MCQRRNRLDTNMDYNWLSVGDTTFDATCVVRKMKPTSILSVAQDVMDMRPCRTGSTKTCSNFHSLDRRNTHHRHTQACTQASIPLTETAQTNWHPKSHHL